MEKKTVDVIIPVYRPGKEFGELLRRLEKQEHRPEKILVMRSGRSARSWKSTIWNRRISTMAEPGRPAQHFLMQIFWYS